MTLNNIYKSINKNHILFILCIILLINCLYRKLWVDIEEFSLSSLSGSSNSNNNSSKAYWGAGLREGDIKNLCKPIDNNNLNEEVKNNRISESWVKNNKLNKNKDPNCKGDSCEMNTGWMVSGVSPMIGCAVTSVNDFDGGKQAAIDMCNKTDDCIGVNWVNESKYIRAYGNPAEIKELGSNDITYFQLVSGTSLDCQTIENQNSKYKNEWIKYCSDFKKNAIAPAFSEPQKLDELSKYLGPIPTTNDTTMPPTKCVPGKCGNDDCPITIESAPQTGEKTTCWDQGGTPLIMLLLENHKKGDLLNEIGKMEPYFGSFPRSGSSSTSSSNTGFIKEIEKSISDETKKIANLL